MSKHVSNVWTTFRKRSSQRGFVTKPKTGLLAEKRAKGGEAV
jgi:hypothetical protein